MNGNWTWSAEQWQSIVETAVHEKIYRARSRDKKIPDVSRGLAKRDANRAAAHIRNAARRAEKMHARPVWIFA